MKSKTRNILLLVASICIALYTNDNFTWFLLRLPFVIMVIFGSYYGIRSLKKQYLQSYKKYNDELQRKS